MLPLQCFMQRVSKQPKAAYLHQPVNGEWTTYSYSDVASMARKVATGLIERGCEKGDRISLISKNCAEWLIADLGIMMAGMVSVPIYPNAGVATIEHVVGHSQAKAIFIGKLDDYTAVDEALGECDRVTFGGYAKEGVDTLTDWFSRFAELQEPVMPLPDDLWTVVYTSGSTGVPKGVGLTYSNIRASSQELLSDNCDVEGRHRVLSYLPLAHVAERAAVEIGSIYADVEVFFNESLETFVSDLQYAKVTQFVSVPRLWAKFQAQVLAQIDYDTLEGLLQSDDGSTVSAAIRDKLGLGHCKIFVSGTAPIAPALLAWYSRIGIEIVEGWGMTETSGVGAANIPFDPSRLGTIGIPVNGLEIKLSEAGEMLIRGDSVFSSYYKSPEATAESFEDGWFRTGDKAEVSTEGVWRIIGRVKEQFKTAKGKYVSPVPIESLVSACPLIEQVCVTGSGQPQPYALVVLAQGVSASNEDVEAELDRLLEDVNAGLESHEQLSGVLVVQDEWSILNEMLTPTMKLKRSNIESAYSRFSDSVRGVRWADSVVA
ncbi:AMP-dependent synthetase [Halioglobus maricola]|uniref:AMP-dependent synthetase n=2 Tax=Halioglobus maricola TaxID=2601894 RepID=A0A5P9NPV8_9GAMM|nr:AMP-dependent synthetase [Halioglobus maricola]